MSAAHAVSSTTTQKQRSRKKCGGGENSLAVAFALMERVNELEAGGVATGELVRVDREKESVAQRTKRFERDALQYTDQLYAAALRYTKNAADAQDLVQDSQSRTIYCHQSHIYQKLQSHLCCPDISCRKELDLIPKLFL